MANMRKAKAAALGLLLLIGCGHAFSDPDRSADRGTAPRRRNSATSRVRALTSPMCAAAQPRTALTSDSKGAVIITKKRPTTGPRRSRLQDGCFNSRPQDISRRRNIEKPKVLHRP